MKSRNLGKLWHFCFAFFSKWNNQIKDITLAKRGNFRIFLPLRFYVKSNFVNVDYQKLPFSHFLDLGSEFCFWQPSKLWKSNFCAKNITMANGNFWYFWYPKNWLHVKFECAEKLWNFHTKVRLQYTVWKNEKFTVTQIFFRQINL